MGNSNIENGSKKNRAIVFGGSDGHGITMTAISARALEDEGFDVKIVCYQEFFSDDADSVPPDSGTKKPEFFWAFTFNNWDYDEGLGKGDIVMVVDIPLPRKILLQDCDAAEVGIKKIRELTDRQIRVILVDHHKRTIIKYNKAIQNGAEVIFSVGPEQYAHYGNPDNYSLFWGAVGAVCDRDVGILPVEEEEQVPFELHEKYGKWLDHEKRSLSKKNQLLLEQIRIDDRSIPEQVPRLEKYTIVLDEKVAFIPDLSEDVGFKQLDHACLCSLNKALYGVGIGPGDSNILVINYWRNYWRKYWDLKELSYPVVLKLLKESDTAGHDTALTIRMDPTDPTCNAKDKAREIIKTLNKPEVKDPGLIKDGTDVLSIFIKIIYDNNEKIPPFLTTHSWLHVDTVMANAKLLGQLSDLSSDQQKILDWAALFHDLGNAAGCYKDIPEFIAILENHDLKSDNLEDPYSIREFHHRLGECVLLYQKQYGYLRNNIPDNILKENFETICMLVKNHRKGDLPDKTDDNIKKLCSLLRIADALDKTKSRARINDLGEKYSEVRKRFQSIIDDPNSSEEERKEAKRSLCHWDGQRAIESIRLKIKNEKNKIKINFEFLITDEKNAKYMINDFLSEMNKIEKQYLPWDFSVTSVNMKTGEIRVRAFDENEPDC